MQLGLMGARYHFPWVLKERWVEQGCEADIDGSGRQTQVGP